MKLGEKYTLKPGECGYFQIHDSRGQNISQGVDIQSYADAERYLGAFAREEGFALETIRTKDGQVDHYEVTINPETMRFSFEAISETEEICSQVEDFIRTLAAKRAAKEGRHHVTSDDIREVALEALKQIATSPTGFLPQLQQHESVG